MRAAVIIRQWMIWTIIGTFALASVALAQDSEQPEQADKFKREELAQMLAPIALYPDSLVTDILMASTYPLEVVEAERWVNDNKDLKGDALDEALQEKTWDASIKVLCHFPELLVSMSDKLDQTRKLGDAFLSQQDDVMALVQELRRKAMDQGNLKSTKEQIVIRDGDVIRIEPADPQIVYVPVYDPFYVYGPWWYPAYPPYYWYYPPGVVVSGGYIGFQGRFFVGVDLFSWYWSDWHRHVIHIDHDRRRRFYRFDHRQRDFDRPFWRHDPFHRRGVAYRDRITSESFGGRTFQRPHPTFENRGFPGTRPGGATVTPSQIQEQRGHPGRRFEGSVVTPPSSVQQGERGFQPRTRTVPSGIQRGGERNTPFSGIGNGRFEKRAGERGEKSRQSEEKGKRGKGFEKQDRGTGGGGLFRGFQRR